MWSSAWITMDWGSRHCTEGNNQDHPQEKERQKCRIVDWGGLTNIWKKKRSKSKGEKERYIHLNAEFQRMVRKDKKAFLSDQCKEIEENNRMGKTRDLFKKIRDSKGIFHAERGTVKERKCMDLTEVEHINKRWQEKNRTIQKRC